MYNNLMNSVAPSDLIVWLRAAGEPSRLRLLALCTNGALSVSELAHALRQSEPRVSRHLRILCEAGLLLRLRQGQWVHYRVAEDARAAGFVRGLLSQLDRRDPGLVRDRAEARSAAVSERDGVPAGTPSRLGRALTAFAEESGLGSGQDTVLAVGVAHLELLASVARAARACTVIAHSRRAAQSVRAFAERSGFTCRVLPASRGADLSDQDLARAGASFDAVLLNPRTGSERALAHLLERAARLVAPGGRLWLFQPYESLESSRERIVEHPLARLRRLLNEAGLVCERLSPIEADGEHLLAAAARPQSRVAQGTAGSAAGGARRAGSGP
jgi:DNA-binding transcriptional ArsR family regulator